MAIYMILNKINEDFYVGSSLNFNQRQIQHRWLLNSNRSTCSILQRAWNKYGKDSFEFKVIEEVDDDNILLRREQYYIDKLEPKYNILKIAGSARGFKMSKESIEKGRTKRLKAILQYDLDGNFIREWSGIADAEKELGIHRASICGCCKGRLRTAGGFVFRHRDEPYKQQYVDETYEGSVGKYKITFQGVTEELVNLRRICEDRNLNYNSVRSYFYQSNNNKVIYKGYTLEKL